MSDLIWRGIHTFLAITKSLACNHGLWFGLPIETPTKKLNQIGVVTSDSKLQNNAINFPLSMQADLWWNWNSIQNYVFLNILRHYNFKLSVLLYTFDQVGFIKSKTTNISCCFYKYIADNLKMA